MTNDRPALNELPALLAAELASLGRTLSSTSREIICGILDDAVARAKEAEAQVALLRGALAAQDERDLAATERLGMPPAGCDTSDTLADEVLELRARVQELEAALAADRAARQWRPITEHPTYSGLYPVRGRGVHIIVARYIATPNVWVDQVSYRVIYPSTWLAVELETKVPHGRE